ncbi:MAG: hypothetical protein Q4C43_02335 [Prevotella sp.]|jgi:hypothetical protein|nr:hypothetical protein [Prevotella sp.]
MNKKRLYVKPATTVVDIEINGTLLSASVEQKQTMTFGFEDANNGDTGDSKKHGFSVWGFDDDEE